MFNYGTAFSGFQLPYYETNPPSTNIWCTTELTWVQLTLRNLKKQGSEVSSKNELDQRNHCWFYELNKKRDKVLRG